MSWLEDAKSGVLKGIDDLGRLRLYKNDGELLPDANLPVSVSDHIDSVANPHTVTDAQVHTGKGGTVEFNDLDDLAHVITVVNGRITSWVKDTVEQLS